MNDTLFQALALIPALVFAIVFHEVAHGWTALALGDPTAREQRRLSLNPLRHIDPFGTLILPGLLLLTGAPAFGWAKPVPVNGRRLRNPRYGMMAVAAAGPLSNLVMAFLASIAMGLLIRMGGNEPNVVTDFVMTSLVYFVLINVFLALFNLLPIPPFDGSHIVEGLLPRSWAAQFGKLRQLGMGLFFLLILLVWLGPGEVIFTHVIFPPVEFVRGLYLDVARGVAGG